VWPPSMRPAQSRTWRESGHVSRQMLKHYSHIGMVAKRRAVESLVSKKAETVIFTPETMPSEAGVPKMLEESAKESPKVASIN
jgi:hypothetical protein